MWKIYCIYNLINNKVYIGKTNDLRKRQNSHLCKLRIGAHYNTHLQRAWNKYKEENFKIEIIDNAITEEEIFVLEKYYIKLSKSYDPNFGYNLTYGGEGGSITDELKIKTSTRFRGIPKSEEHKKKIGLSNKGKNLGKKHSNDHVEKIRYSLYKQVQPNETKKKRALTQTGAGNHRYGKPAKNRKRVNVYDKNLTFIKKYDYIKQASQDLKLNSSMICQSCKTGKLYKQFYFKYDEVKEDK